VPSSQPVRIPVPAGGALGGSFVPPAAGGPVVVFAHGSGSSRHSPRNQQVAARLSRDGLGTLLVDLLVGDEDVFDIALLAERLALAVDWLSRSSCGPLGLFGASTGAAAALVVAAGAADRVGAVVSRGGRPDLAGDALALVRAPTLLVVGGLDETVLNLNRRAAAVMTCEHDVVVVPGATHLFEEPGALDEVGELAAGWFSQHLSRARA
jgi:putative phosphoribosyl transferase